MRTLDDLTMFAYGFLDPPAEEAMKEHLRKCRACARLHRRIVAEHTLFRKSLAREYPDLPAWVAGAAFRDRPQF